jgi:cell division protein ZapA (FtsZ GTPase activity inhibitor)
MKSNFALISFLLVMFAFFLITELFKMKKEIRKLNKITKYLLNKRKSNNE